MFDIPDLKLPTLDEWKGFVQAGIEAAARTTKADIAAGDSLPGQYVGTWVSFAAPDGFEAWCDVPGILAIEVPVEFSDALLAWVEENGVRCGREIGAGKYCVIHANARLSPLPPTPPPVPEPVVEGGE